MKNKLHEYSLAVLRSVVLNKKTNEEEVRHFRLMSHNIKWNLRLEANATSIFSVIFTAHKGKICLIR